MGPAKIAGFDFTPRFKREYRRVAVDIRKEVDELFDELLKNPNARRCHNLKGYKPTIYVVDVFSNHSWQISFEMDGEKAVLRRLAGHKEIDDAP